MAEEPGAKRAKTEESYYKTIDGVKYDRALLETVEKFVADGQVGYIEAKHLWNDAHDGKEVTDTEKVTLEYAMKEYKFSEKALNFLNLYMNAGTHKSFYKVIDGVKYDRQLLEAAEMAAADGQISWREAKQLLEDAHDGKGITGTEKDTLEYVLKSLTLTDKARNYLNTQLKIPAPPSYYKVIEGIKHDALLLLEVEDAAKNGLISEAEAKRLWEAAGDGKGVTEIEQVTLKYALATIKFTDPARTYLETKLAA